MTSRVLDDECRLRVLGPVEVLVDGQAVRPAGRQGALLALLAAASGATVSVDRLADALWPEDAPRDPGNALQILVSRIRARAGGGLVETRPGGYRLGVPDAEVDAAVFESLVAEAAAAGPERAEPLLARAERLWRGPAFAAYDDLPGVREPAARLAELRWSARERHGHALVELGRYADAVAGLEPVVLAEPLREGAVAELATALARTGRAAEALGRLADLRALLAESGLDPSARLEVLQQRVLAGDLGPPADTGALGASLHLVCRQLRTREGHQVTYGEVGTGPTLVFVPGWVSRLDALTTGLDPRGRVLAALAEERRVVTYDRYGTGLSPGVVGSFDLDTSVAELVALLDELREEAVVVFASSAASPIAVAAAARDPRIAGLVVLGGYADGPAVFDNPGVRQAMVDLVRSSWGVGSRVLANLVMPDRYDERAFARFQRQVADAATAAGFLQQMYDADVTDRLADVRQPTLVLHYADDPAVPLAGARQLADGIAGARLHVLEGAYHLPPARDAARVAEEVLAWCRSAMPGHG
ncbi:MAG TPA: alpha/beta fold hydrolase [Nocardioides sp.]|nr:alpha/beta fold hydrolase [Nocardioides sp.]